MNAHRRIFCLNETVTKVSLILVENVVKFEFFIDLDFTCDMDRRIIKPCSLFLVKQTILVVCVGHVSGSDILKIGVDRLGCHIFSVF